VLDGDVLSTKTIYRWLHGELWRDDRGNSPLVPDFPKPIKIAGRNYWRLASVQRFLTARERAMIMEAANG
jgi:predicted DNA-binding transcriptional regulator AlpA